MFLLLCERDGLTCCFQEKNSRANTAAMAKLWRFISPERIGFFLQKLEVLFASCYSIQNIFLWIFKVTESGQIKMERKGPSASWQRETSCGKVGTRKVADISVDDCSSSTVLARSCSLWLSFVPIHAALFGRKKVQRRSGSENSPHVFFWCNASVILSLRYF